MEMLAILIIPLLIKARLQDEQEIDEKDKITDLFEESLQPPEGLLQYVLNIILHDVTDSIEPKVLNKELLAEIFRSYGESEIADDEEILEAMLKVARGGKVLDGEEPVLMLDKETFTRALTSDVMVYDLKNEFSEQTVINEAEGFGNRKQVGVFREFFKLEWFSEAIDLTAENYPSQMIFTSLWASFVLYYFVSSNITGNDYCPALVKQDYAAYIECRVVAGLIIWLVRVAVVM